MSGGWIWAMYKQAQTQILTNLCSKCEKNVLFWAIRWCNKSVIVLSTVWLNHSSSAAASTASFELERDWRSSMGRVKYLNETLRFSLFSRMLKNGLPCANRLPRLRLYKVVHSKESNAISLMVLQIALFVWESSNETHTKYAHSHTVSLWKLWKTAVGGLLIVPQRSVCVRVCVTGTVYLCWC